IRAQRMASTLITSKEVTMRRFSVLVLALAVLAAALPGEAQQQKNITWTAGQVGGGWYSQAGGFVELIKSKDPAFNIKVIPGAGSDEWVMRKVFEFYKTTYADVRSRGGKVILVSYTDLANQYRDRNMDILFANLAVPGAAIQEASLGRKMRILPMDEDLIKF